MGAHAGRRGRARRLRPRRAQDPLQGRAGRAPRGRRHPRATSTWHGQLQPVDRARLHRPVATSPARDEFGDDAARAVQPAHRLLAPPSLEAARRRAARPARTGSSRSSSARRARGDRAARIIAKMNALVDAPRHRGALPGVAGGRVDRPDRPRHLLPAAGRARRLARTSACVSIVDRFLEHARIFYFEQRRQARGLPVVAPTGCRATSTAGSRSCSRSRTRVCATA